MRQYSTIEVARLVGIGEATLRRWLAEGKVPEPKRWARLAGVRYRIWTRLDIERVRRYKARFYCKGRGRKPKGGKR